MLDVYLRALALKDESRTGWELRGVRAPESVADHSWGTALLCILYAARAGVDGERAVRMAVIHDIAEAVTGDVATRVALMDKPDVIAEKQQRERLAMADLLQDGLPGSSREVQELWEEYEMNSTDVARFVRDMNLIDMCAQALTYERDGRYNPAAPNDHFPEFEGMDEFFATTEPRVATPVGRELFEELVTRYELLSSVRARGGPAPGPPS
jgi:putative hydrolase of HD superfamily